METLTSLLVPILAFLLAGLAVAVLWMWWKSAPAWDEDAEVSIEPEEPVQSPVTVSHEIPQQIPEKVIVPESGQQTVPSTPSMTVEVFRVLRDLTDGALVIQIDGKQYRDISSMDHKTLHRFQLNVEALDEFPADAGALPVAPDQVMQEPDTPASRPEAMPPSPPVFAPRPSLDMSEPLSFGNFNLRLGKKKAEEEKEPPPKSMADEIEEILQYRLAMDESMRDRSIHVRTNISGGVRVEVDGRYFDGVGDIDDEDAKAFIQGVIREWESRRG